MPVAIGVKFRRNGPLSYHTPGEDVVRMGDHVVVETGRGPELGEVVLAASDIQSALLPADVRPVLRIATEEDMVLRRDLDLDAVEHVRIARERARELGLDVKIVAATPSFDGLRVLFDYSSEARIDFRELAKDLASLLRRRVELRWVQARDEAKIQDGYGPCGRRLCCSSWLKEFEPVSIKHAKEQGLPLNPSKLNGMCGKLKCCLVYENDQYADLKGRLPRLGAVIEVPAEDGGGEATVREINVPRELVILQLTDTGGVVKVPAERLASERPRARQEGDGTGGSRRKRRRSGGAGADPAPSADRGLRSDLGERIGPD